MMAPQTKRKNNGAVLPLVAVAALLFVAFLAFSLDISRNIQAAQQLQFAAESAGLDAFSHLVDDNGPFSRESAMNNARNAVAASHGSNAWNSAPIGPDADLREFYRGVTIASEDVVFGTNMLDPDEPILRITARRAGSDALRFLFLPAIYAINSLTGGSVPRNAASVDVSRTVEIVGMPATLVGAGAPHNASSKDTLSGWATFPLAISYEQFLDASHPAQVRSVYDLELLDSTKPFAGAAAPNVLRGAFVNVLRRGNGSAYYGTASGGADMNDLFDSLSYFSVQESTNGRPPAIVERGSGLWTFDLASSAFASSKARILQALREIVQNAPGGRRYIMPVLASDPRSGQQGTVVGFALLRLVRVSVGPGSEDFALRVAIENSLPARNVASATHASVPFPGGLMPAPPSNGPFAVRSLDHQTGSFSRLHRGVCLAPVTSPRLIREEI